MTQPSSVSGLVDRAARLAQTGQVADALQLLSRLWRRGHHRAGLVAAELLLAQGDDRRAVACLRGIDPARLPDEATRLELARQAVALRCWAVAVATLAHGPTDRAEWASLRLSVAEQLGRPDELRAAGRQLAVARPIHLPRLLAHADSLLGAHEPRAVLELLEVLPATERARPELLQRHIRALLDAGQPAEGAIEAWMRTQTDADGGLQAVVWWVWAKQPERASQLADACSREWPTHAGLLDWRARFALWRGDFAAAEGLARQVEPPSATTHRTLAIACLQLHGAPRALPLLQAHLEQHPADAIARCWLATALRGVGRLSEARDEAIAARSRFHRYHLPSRIEMWLARHRLEGGFLYRQTEEVEAQLAPLGLDHLPVPRRLLTALDRFRGNRTTVPTTAEEGVLRPYPLPGDPRELARTLQHRIRFRPLEEVLRGFDDLLQRFGDHPLVLTHRGELLLWVGQNARAVSDFERALEQDPTTRWAWIGLGASQIMEGQLERGLATFDRGIEVIGFAGPTLFAYRAEAHRIRGDRSAALRDLHAGLQVTPKRLSLWMHAAELEAEQGNLVPAKALWALLEARLPGLILDTGGPEQAPVAAFARMRAAFVGNRASTLLTWLHEGRIRSAMWAPLPESVRACFPVRFLGHPES